MPTLSVKNFSCIDEAHLELSPITVIIGPQASGKSVLSKLTYFFYSLLRDLDIYLEDRKKIDAFKEHIRTKFHEWFPSTAWGQRQFCINFTAGQFEIRLMRSVYKGVLGERFRITLSPFIENHYQAMTEAYEAALKRSPRNTDPRMEYEFSWKLMELAETRLRKALGDDHVDSQLFVPAGRSFFTSIGKAVVAFEQTRMLDPTTAIFGRHFAAFKDRHFYRKDRRPRSKRPLAQVMDNLLGGTVRFERDREYVETVDGRKIPFSALSSGQQELLPLLLMLTMFDVDGASSMRHRRLVYIEEPEAHLFPNAQSVLVEALVGLVVSSRPPLTMVMTTHSPYVLSKLNNLVKAGTLAEALDEKAKDQLNQIVAKQYWLPPKRLLAYAIIDRRLVSITCPEGFIDGDYLDNVSGEMAREYDSLLELEVEHEFK